MTATKQLTGKIDYRHVYLNFTKIEVDLGDDNMVQTCPAAVGPGFAAGTTDGPGLGGFQQGDKSVSIPPLQYQVINEKWIQVRDELRNPSQSQGDCQKPKPVLLDIGEMFEPYAWAVRPINVPINSKILLKIESNPSVN